MKTYSCCIEGVRVEKTARGIDSLRRVIMFNVKAEHNDAAIKLANDLKTELIDYMNYQEGMGGITWQTWVMLAEQQPIKEVSDAVVLKHLNSTIPVGS